MSASLIVQQNCADPECSKSSAAAKTTIVLFFGLVLYPAIGLPLSAETGKLNEVSSKPPAVDKLAPGEPGPAAALAQNRSDDPADCVQPGVVEKSTAEGSELDDNVPSALSPRGDASSGDPEVGAQSSAELITDKLKLFLELKPSPASDPQAAQCGHQKTGAQAEENGHAPPN